MLLVDTSVWIEVFRRSPRVHLDRLIDFDEVVTCLPVIQEVLQGFRDERAFQTARDAMYALPIVAAPLSAQVVDQAIDLYRSARRAGFTIRSGVDCLIAACAHQALADGPPPRPRLRPAGEDLSPREPQDLRETRPQPAVS